MMSILKDHKWKFILLTIGQPPEEVPNSERHLLGKLVKITNCQTQESKIIYMSNQLINSPDNEKRERLESFLSKKVQMSIDCHLFIEITDKKYD